MDSDDFSGFLSSGEIDTPQGMKIYKNRLYIVDRIADTVEVFDRSFNNVLSIGGSGTGDGQFDVPDAISIYNDEIYVTDSSLRRITVFDLSGNYLRKWGQIGNDDDDFLLTGDIFVKGGLVYISDENFDGVNFQSYIKIFDTFGNFVDKFGGTGSGDGEFIGTIAENSIYSIGEVLYVSNGPQRHIQLFTLDGNFISKYQDEGSGDGQLLGIAAISAFMGKLYALDYENKRISVFESDMTFIRNIDLSTEIGNFSSIGGLTVG